MYNYFLTQVFKIGLIDLIFVHINYEDILHSAYLANAEVRVALEPIPAAGLLGVLNRTYP